MKEEVMNNLDPMKVVLSIVDHEYPVEVDIDRLGKDKKLFKSTIKLAEKNGLYYYFIYKLKELGVNLPLSEEDHWNKENQKLSEFKETISLLNKVSEDYGIDYIIIKACNAIPHIPRDIDIFVRTEDRTKIIEALEDNGMKCVLSDVTGTVLQKEGYIEVELYSKICYLGMDFIEESLFGESNVKDKMFEMEYSGLNNEVNFLLMLIHRLLGHRSMSLLDFLHMNALKDDINIDACRGHAHEKGWGSVFDLAVNKLNILHGKIYREGEVVPFPYLFDRKFILECVSKLDGLKMGKCVKIIFYISLIEDGIVCKLKDSFLYNLLKSFKPTRILIGFFTRQVRKARGDVHR